MSIKPRTQSMIQKRKGKHGTIIMWRLKWRSTSSFWFPVSSLVSSISTLSLVLPVPFSRCTPSPRPPFYIRLSLSPPPPPPPLSLSVSASLPFILNLPRSLHLSPFSLSLSLSPLKNSQSILEESPSSLAGPPGAAQCCWLHVHEWLLWILKLNRKTGLYTAVVFCHDLVQGARL